MSRSPRSAAIPDRDGVSASTVSLPVQGPGTRPWASLLDFLAARLSWADRAAWAERMAQGAVLDEAGQALAAGAPYLGGSRVHYFRSLPVETPIPGEARVVFADHHLVVADKPHFLPVAPVGRYVQETLLVRLKRSLNLPDLVPLHRIDRETAGLVLFAVQPAERGRYHALFSEQRIEKIYEAVAPFARHLALPITHRSHLRPHPTDFFRTHEEAAASPNSETQIELLERRGDWARYRLRPVSGKRHQLRVHMNALGLPIVGDQLYPNVLRGLDEPEDFRNPLRLLAQAIAFTDPVTHEARCFQSARNLDWPRTP